MWDHLFLSSKNVYTDPLFIGHLLFRSISVYHYRDTRDIKILLILRFFIKQQSLKSSKMKVFIKLIIWNTMCEYLMLVEWELYCFHRLLEHYFDWLTDRFVLFWLVKLTEHSRIMWFEKVHVWLAFVEKNILYPVVWLSTVTWHADQVANKFGTM